MRVSTSRNQAKVDPQQAAGGDDAHERGGGVAAEVAADKHPVMAAYGDGVQGAFGGIVVGRQFAVLARQVSASTRSPGFAKSHNQEVIAHQRAGLTGHRVGGWAAVPFDRQKSRRLDAFDDADVAPIVCSARN